MNKFYTKLDITFPYFDYSLFKKNLYNQYDGTNLSYYFIENESQLRSMAPEILGKIGPFAIKLVELPGPAKIPPHKDYGLSAAINFYFKPGLTKTFWYNPNIDAHENISHESMTRMYDINDITLSDSFISSLNECYLLNSSEIHSVTKYDTGLRQFLQFQFDISYEEILNKLNNFC